MNFTGTGPDSWQCVEYHPTPYVPGFYLTYPGPPNFQKYCSITYLGSQAVMVSAPLPVQQQVPLL